MFPGMGTTLNIITIIIGGGLGVGTAAYLGAKREERWNKFLATKK